MKTSNSKKELINELRAYILNDQLTHALNGLETYARDNHDSALDTKVMLMHSRLVEIKNENSMGTVNDNTYRSEVAKIRKSLVDLIKELEEESSEKLKLNQAQPVANANKKKQRALIIVLLSLLVLISLSFIIIPLFSTQSDDERQSKLNPESTNPITPPESGENKIESEQNPDGDNLADEPSTSENKRGDNKAGQTDPATSNINGNTRDTPVTPQPPVSYKVTLVVNADMSKGKIFVDGVEVQPINENLNFKTILVEEKSGAHQISIKHNGKECNKSQYVKADIKRLNICN